MISSRDSRDINTYINYLIDHSTAESPMWNIERVREGKPVKWNYIDGCMITAVLSIYEMTQDPKYLSFADDFVGWFVQEDGSIRTYDPEECNLDNINMARSLFPLWRLTGKERYRRAMDTVRHQLDIQPRTSSGSFWHKKIYPDQVWLDGLYMAQPFYMEYETILRNMENCNDSFRQFTNARQFMRDEKTGLYYHGYDESRRMYWADPVTGCSRNFWLRAEGWFACALVDTAEIVNEQLYDEKRTLQRMLWELADALAPWQQEDGLFCQVIDKPDAPGNYEETSGTALIAYAILKGVRLDYLPKRYEAMGEKALEGLIRNRLIRHEDGTLGLDGICLVAGLGGKQHRDGSLEYYFSEPVVKDDAKGTAPFILAYTEMLRRQ